ncbi:hypothetical protein [Flectobacillus roseus]|uniref:hypothetical protein n=1 Tax=Flectobacillus roseus TaxID=502259 RepID=UPI0024B80E9D|nr:hypothetical protein [Flectobacillus roseus]MDI9870704.1 hypothetical protein [Flectobacillus roseus]
MAIGKYFTVMVATSIKFFNGPIAGLLLELTWWETAVCTILGMMLTVISVLVIGTSVRSLIQKYRKTPAKLFSRRTRFAVKLWKRVGIWGISCFTPLFFTPIGGTLLALSFRVSVLRILVTMSVFAVFWGITLTYALFQLSTLQALLLHK